MADTNTPPEPEEHDTGNVRSLSAIWPFVRPHLKLLAAAIAVLLATAGIALTLPFAFRLVVDGFNDPSSELHSRYFLLAILVVALLALGSSLRNFLTKILGEKVALDMRKAIFARMIRMSPAFFERTMTGEVLSRITADTTLILLVVANSLGLALRHSVMLTGGLILLFITSPKLMGLVLLIVPLVMVPILVLGRHVRANAADNQKWIAASSANASEALYATQTIQAFAAEGQATTAFNDVTAQALASARKMVTSHSLLNGIVITLVFCGMLGVLWIGSQEVRAGAISVGQLVQFAFYSVIVATSVAAFSDVWGEAQRAAGAAERLAALLEAKDTITDREAPAPLNAEITGRIAFEDVRFFYPTRPSVAALDSVSLTVAPGETVALVGPSGAGKSTILQLLLRFYDPGQGRITLDGMDLRDMARTDLRGNVAIVQQDPTIFAASVRDNIRFGRPGASDTEVENAAIAAAAHDFISALPDGYDTFVGERGVMLSGGQKQRIAIARAILKDAPVLLLDEATSALDSESEQAIQAAVERLAKDRTTLVIAHRLATVENADRILVFEAGKIVGNGRHADLIAEDGLYARYAQLQLISDKT
jgi:ATP-binding cassette subfamily B protein